MSFKLTYSTMFDPPEEMHLRFEAALAEVKAGLGAVHPLYLDGEDVDVEGEPARDRSAGDRANPSAVGAAPRGRPARMGHAGAEAGDEYHGIDGVHSDAKVEPEVGHGGPPLPIPVQIDSRPSPSTYAKTSPVDRRIVLGHFPVGAAAHVDRAMAAARRAFPAWRSTPPAERVRLVRRAAQLLEERVYTIGAALSLEVGKNRMEGLGEAQETADFFWGYAQDYEAAGYFDRALPDDPLAGWRSHNRSVLKPYGVWGVIAPFNFPLALAGGPTAAALVTGNTVVLKGATDTPWAGRLLADCLRDAGLPPGVFQYLYGSGAVVGEALIQHPDLAGITFTGSQAVGMHIHRRMLAGGCPRPCIAEMGGKNACIVTARGDLERAATGIVRSAFGLSGQKCSALSRVYVEDSVADALLEKVVEKTRAIRIGDPILRENWMGPVIHAGAVRDYSGYCDLLRDGGAEILCGGAWLRDGDLAHGSFVAPTVAEAPLDHPLYAQEMFLPILMVGRVRDLNEAIERANASDLGLTAGCYGSDAEVRTFLDRIEAGVTYVNRPQGATTGAWPGYQAFGGWKGSGSTGKAIGSFYYLPQYLREQSQTWVE